MTEDAPRVIDADEKVDALHDAGRQLLVGAFRAARRSGRLDWDRMTMAVLKNRILDLTGREFDQQAWEAATFRDFVELFPDIVRVDRSSRPPVIELLPTARDETAAGAPEPMRPPPQRRTAPWLIRPDLWHSVLDYSSGDLYLWDDGAAVRVPVAQHDATDARPQLPTATPDLMRQWRSAFAETATADVDQPEVVAAVNRWRDESLTGIALPARLRGRWIETLKHLVLDRLQEWFSAAGLTPPADLIERPERPITTDDTDQLRDLVLRCVRAMTRAELEELRLSPAVFLRTRR